MALMAFEPSLMTSSLSEMAKLYRPHSRIIPKLFSRRSSGARAKQIRLNSDKIELKKASMPCTGHILSSEGVQADLGIVKAILEMTALTDVARVRRILGTINYRAKFLPHFSQISETPRELGRNGQPIARDKPHDDLFLETKKLISTKT